MAPKKIPTKREDRTAARLYWRKADEFLRAAVSNLTERRWNAAALSAIHGAITAADAAIVLARGLRSSSQRHEDLPDLLVTSLPESATVVPHFAARTGQEAPRRVREPALFGNRGPRPCTARRAFPRLGPYANRRSRDHMTEEGESAKGLGTFRAVRRA